MKLNALKLDVTVRRRRYSIKVTDTRVSFRDVTDSRTGVSVSDEQKKELEALYAMIQKAVHVAKEAHLSKAPK